MPHPEQFPDKPRSNNKMETFRGEAMLLSTVFLCGLALRLAAIAFLGGYSVPPVFDGISYDVLAYNLVSGNGFALDTLTAFRPPGYPLFLAAIYSLFGRDYAWIRIFQAILGALSALPIYILARQVWSRPVAVLGALGMAAHPILIYFTQAIYPETLMVLLACILLMLTIAPSGGMSTRRGFLVGLLLGLMSLIRPATLVLGVWFALWIPLRSSGRWRGVATAGALIDGTLILVLPWTLRNYRVCGAFVPIATNGGVNLWAGSNPLANGGRVDPSPETWLDADPPQGFQGWPGLTEVQSEQRFRHTALAWIQGHPAESLALLPRKLVRSQWINFGAQDKRIDLPVATMFAYAVFLGASLTGVFLSIQHWRRLVPMYLLALHTILMSLIFFGSTRQSALLVPIQVLLAAVAVARPFGEPLLLGAKWLRRDH